MMGIWLSRQRDRAVLSMTPRRKLRASRYFRLGSFFGVRVGLGVGFVNTVDAVLGHEHHVGGDLNGSEGGGGVGGEIGVAGAGSENDDAALFEVTHGTATNVRFGDRLDWEGGLDSSVDALFLEGVLHDKGVDYGGEHARVVCGGAVHAVGCSFGASPDVSATDDHGDLAVRILSFPYLARDEGNSFIVDANTPIACKGLAADFYE